MRSRVSMRGIARWAGTVLCFLIAGAWLITIPITPLGHMRASYFAGSCWIKLDGGHIAVWWLGRSARVPAFLPTSVDWITNSLANQGLPSLGWTGPVRVDHGPPGTWIRVALWPQLVIAFAPTAWLWRRHGRPVHRRGVAGDPARAMLRVATRGAKALACVIFVYSLGFALLGAKVAWRFWGNDEALDEFLARTGIPEDVAGFGAVLLCAVLSLAVAIGAYRRMRWHYWDVSGTQCFNCGYDLTGNVSGMCPECGVAVGFGARSAKQCVGTDPDQALNA